MVPPDIPGGSVDTLRAATDISAERRAAPVRRGFRGRRPGCWCRDRRHQPTIGRTCIRSWATRRKRPRNSGNPGRGGRRGRARAGPAWGGSGRGLGSAGVRLAGVRSLQMALDEAVARLAEGKNLATVVALMPSGHPPALLTWVAADDEH